MSAAGEVAVKSDCEICNRGDTAVVVRNGIVVHKLPRPPQSTPRYTGLARLKVEGEMVDFDTGRRFKPCPNWDGEFRHAAEPLGFYIFAWRPRRCRNGKLRWLTFVERHADHTYTLGNRAH